MDGSLHAGFGGRGSSSVAGKTPQSVYDALAATGVELVKFDFWDGSGKCWYTDRDWMFHSDIWPNGFDYAAKAHKAGLKASLYMGGTYKDCDLTTIAGRDAELAAVLTRYDQGWFDMWRTDLYTAPSEPDAPNLSRRFQFPVRPGPHDRESAGLPL